jgi:hypothetical protein
MVFGLSKFIVFEADMNDQFILRSDVTFSYVDGARAVDAE